MEKAFELGQEGIELNNSYGGGHMLLGHLYAVQRQYDKAVSEMEQAVALSPNNDECLSSLAGVYTIVGKRDEALKLARQAVRLNPSPIHWEIANLGEALCFAGQYDEAIETLKKARHLMPNDRRTLVTLAVAYSLSGREKEARAMVDELYCWNAYYNFCRYNKRSRNFMDHYSKTIKSKMGINNYKLSLCTKLLHR